MKEEKSEKDKMNEKAIDVALKEYEELWHYYQHSLEEHKQIFDWYFKIAALPTAVVGAVIAWAPGANKLNIDFGGWNFKYIMAGLLCAFFLSGLAIFATYSRISANEHLYEGALKKLRDFFKTQMPCLTSAIIIDELFDAKGNKKWWFGVKFLRPLAIVPLNCIIGTAAFFLFFNRPPTTLMIISLIAFFLILHFVIHGSMVIPKDKKES